jgi:metal-responsive CopG/Arc/MetJ family transcriptional regulator
METIGRISVSFTDEYEFEYEFLKGIPNKSKFINKMTKEYISNDNNLTPVEKFIKLQIPNKKK